MALITETNAQYYAGQQTFAISLAGVKQLTFTFDTPLVSAYNAAGASIGPNSNFNLYKLTAANPTPSAANLIPETEVSVIGPDGNIVRSTNAFPNPCTILCQLKAFAIDNNYGSYSYITVEDVINNFLVGYVGEGKMIQGVKRTDVLFHARRGMQEFSYDMLKVIKSQELTIPPHLTVPLPQDYVNYVRCSWVDKAGAKHIIYPTRVTSNPTELPIQDSDGIPTQDSFGGNLDAQQSLTEERWKDRTLTQNYQPSDYRYPKYPNNVLGQRYGLEPEEANVNGWFTINERLGSFSFSNDLVGKLIIFEYLSDGLAVDEDSKLPKMAEEAMYMHIAYGVLSTRFGVPEYIVGRFKRDRSSAMRNAKIRLSNIKTDEIVQVMRGKSKWIKH